MYIIFLIAIFLIFIVSYLIFQKELFAPPVMMVLVFLFCGMVVLARYDDWDVSKYSVDSALLLILGLISFIIGGGIAYFATSNIYIKGKGIGINYQDDIRDRVNVPGVIGFIGVIICGVEVLLFYRYVISTVLSMNYKHTSLASTLVSYRWASMQNLIPNELAMPGYLSILKYSTEVFSVFALYVVIHNIIFGYFKKKDIFQAIILLTLPVNAFLSSSRGDILILLAEMVYLIYFFLGIKNGFGTLSDMKVVRKGIRILIIFLVFFIAFAAFQNRYSESNTILNSLSIYIGGGIRAFDEFVKDPLPRNRGLIGNDETLRYFSTFMSVHRGQGEKTLLPLEFSYINGKSIGNIYTAFRRYYSDFRIPGIIIFSVLLGFIMTQLYCKSRNACMIGKNSFVVLAFAYLSKPVFYMAIEDFFYVSNVSLNGLFKLLLLYFLFCVFAQRKKLVIGWNYR